MIKKVSNNFSEFLQDTSSYYMEREKQEILILIREEVDGVLKQINMLTKSFNSTIEFEELKNKFYHVLDNSDSSINTLTKNIYDFCYQEIFSKIIRDGDYALKSNKYQASPEKIKLLETTLSNHKKNVIDSQSVITAEIERQNDKFIKNAIISELISCLDELFFDIPCKQNENAYNDSCNLLERTTNIMVDQLNEIFNSYIQLFNNDVTVYLENKIRFEDGCTSNSNFTLSQLLEAKKTALDTKPSRRGRKKKVA